MRTAVRTVVHATSCLTSSTLCAKCAELQYTRAKCVHIQNTFTLIKNGKFKKNLQLTQYYWRIPLSVLSLIIPVASFITTVVALETFRRLCGNFGCQNRCLSAGEEAEIIFRTLTQFSSSCVTLVSSQKVPLAWEQGCNATQDGPQCFATPKIKPLNFDNSDL